ncbi:MAG: putative glycoside hydrolase family 15 protein [Pseudomonadota bacterium]|nr:putative glycoside hydrolase family 15 protein [Pseudomonadota bacterium]
MERWRGGLIAAVLACLLSSAVSAATAPFSLPVPVPDRIGRAQIFDYRLKDKNILIGRRDFLWAAATTGPVVPGVYSTSYMTVDRDLDKSHDLAWYKANHPDWIVYGCDGQPTHEFTGQYVNIDISNPAVRQALYKQGVVDAQAKRPYEAIGVDNLANTNGFYECGVRRDGAMHRLYSGQKLDPTFADQQADWMRWLAPRVHARGLALTGNLNYGGADRADFLKIARYLDIVLDEEGFERHCGPSQTDAAWLDRITLFRDLARSKALISMEYVCPTLAQITPATIDWSLANYLLMKGDRTYLALLPEELAAGVLYDFPELYLKIGRPMGAMDERGGVYFRRFERALALVNPSSTTSARFELGREGWRDRTTRRLLAGPIELAPATAMVLVKAGA